MRYRTLPLVLGIALALSHAAPAQEQAAEPPAEQSETKYTDWPEPSKTTGRVSIGGEGVSYNTTAGTMEMTDYDGQAKAQIFYVSYIVPRGEGDDPRPLTFVFNGGPGSSSVWLHLGALGPKRVEFAYEAEPDGVPALPQPPYRVVDNEFSWLDVTDLVFIDPVGTGYSRPVEGEKKEQFHGLREDIQWVGDFIRLWTTRNERWDSPIFLAGESYGTTRAAGLAGYLQDTHGMYLSGIALISPVLNFQTIRFDTGNDTPYWLYLPTYTATAWYHKKLGGELQENLDEALRQSEAFAQGPYLVALAKGDALQGEERANIRRELARLTGLSEDFLEQSRLRIHISEFTKELLRDEGRSVGRLDSRYRGFDRRDTADSPDYDPSYAAIQGPFTAAMNHYVRSELGYKNDRPYEILTGRVHPWSYAGESNRYANVGETLRGAMSKNPALRVLVACGYYDLATPHFAADYTVRHLGLPPELRDNITLRFYRSGHMMYIRYADLEKLKEDILWLYRPQE